MHFCTVSKHRVHAFCAHEITEGAGSKKPCFKCEPAPFLNCKCLTCKESTVETHRNLNLVGATDDAIDVNPNKKRNILCMGMFYASEAYVTKYANAPEQGQGCRDRLRCLKLEENLDVMVYTVDDKHDPLRVSIENNRHYYGKFDRPTSFYPW